jgi:thioredoxin reductase (NADPH)
MSKQTRREDMFPKLTEAHIARLRPLGDERTLSDGEVLWEQGDRHVPFHVVLAGRVGIYARADEEPIVVHEPGEFTGDVDILSARRTVVLARAHGATRVLRIEADRLHALLQTDAELGELLLGAFILRRVELISGSMGGLMLIGSHLCHATLPLQEFLTRNGLPFRFLDVDRDPAAAEILQALHVRFDEAPVLVCRGGRVLKRPSIAEVGEQLGLSTVSERAVRDVVVVGAGPAGLSAAVYAASEGLDVLVLETYAPGGQAGSSSRIENYLGFPTGISGQDLAGRAFVQAEKFGAEMSVARTAVKLSCAKPLFEVDVGAGASVQARAIIVATGAEYRRPSIPELRRFEGVGVYYGATAMEASVCQGEEVIVVGGGNSAGQAAVFLADRVSHVHMLVRGPALKDTMSRYLIRRIEESLNITLHTQTEIQSVAGATHLESVTCRDRAGVQQELRVRHVFLMTGARPNTAWLAGCVALDSAGFIKTGADLGEGDLRGWPLEREPSLFETSVPRIFAIGDVRANSVKRVAAAVGEGSVCVSLLHKALAG